MEEKDREFSVFLIGRLLGMMAGIGGRALIMGLFLILKYYE